MTTSYPKASDVDIVLLLEGTYPFVKGGVSEWVYKLIRLLPEFRFGAIFIGGQKQDYSGLRYPLPENLVHLEAHYLFDQHPSKPLLKPEQENAIETLRELHNKFSDTGNYASLGKELHQELFSTMRISRDDFLHSHFSWDYILQSYKEKCPSTTFLDYFWSVRNMHVVIWQLTDIIRKAPKVRVIHSISTGYAGFLGALMQYERHCPYVLTEHGNYVRERKIDLLGQWYQIGNAGEQRIAETQDYLTNMWVRFFEILARLAYSSADPIISLFKAYQEIQIDNGAMAEKTRVIPNGVPVDKSMSLKKMSDDKAPVIALIGRVMPVKDIKNFIKAMVIVSEHIPKVKALIIGPTGEDPAYFEECKQLVNVLNLSHHVSLVGVQNVERMLPTIDLIVLCSISEGLPLVLLEAFAAGIPAVSTDVGACKELIYGKMPEDQALGASGIIVPVADAKQLAQAMIDLLSDKKRYEAAQHAGRSRVLHYYTEEQLINNYRQIYQQAINVWQE